MLNLTKQGGEKHLNMHLNTCGKKENKINQNINRTYNWNKRVIVIDTGSSSNNAPFLLQNLLLQNPKHVIL